jgi:A/G-specific adenine glycosylase
MPRKRGQRRLIRGSFVRNKPANLADALLHWYDAHRRTFLWRASAGTTPEPYRVWLAEVMLQQTTVTTVAPYYARFLEAFPTLEHLAQAPLERVLSLWAGLGYYSRARNLHACAQRVWQDYNGVFPRTQAELLKLPGVGAYTAGAVAAIAFDEPVAAVDGNVERVLARLYAVETPFPAARSLIRERAQALVPQKCAGDFAQALMDLGSTVCTPRPKCDACPWQESCQAYDLKTPESFPKKSPKAAKAVLYGIAYVIWCSDGAVLARTRPNTGLLARMSEVPMSALEQEPPLFSPPLKGDYKDCGGVRHIFSHIDARLQVFSTLVSNRITYPPCRWIEASCIKDEPFPTFVRKILATSQKIPSAPYI